MCEREEGGRKGGWLGERDLNTDDNRFPLLNLANKFEVSHAAQLVLCSRTTHAFTSILNTMQVDLNMHSLQI